MSEPELSLDVESRSAFDLRKGGAHAYWRHPTTALWCAAYAFDQEPPETWLPGQPCPPRIAAHVAAGGRIFGYNVSFERLAWTHCLGPTHGWPVPALRQFEDTAAAAAAMSLPRDLAGAAKALGLDVQKDDEGHRLMMQMAKPRKARKGEAPGLYWQDDADKLARLVEYNKTDVVVERAIRDKVVPLSDAERGVFFLDQEINERGVRIDVELVRAMQRIVDHAKLRLDSEMLEVTGGRVTAASQVAKLTSWLRDNGVAAESLAKAALDDLLALPGTPDNCRRALEIRREAAKSSNAKLEAALACVCDDGRARGLLLYHGAGTGRWTGKLLQPQNFVRGSGVVEDPTAAARWMMQGSAPLIEMMYGPPLAAVSDCLRSTITADPGRELIAADFANIEGRGNAWVAGDEDKLTAFRDYDVGAGPDLYKLGASGILGKPVEDVTKDERQALGKVPELALGYQGGVNAFFKMAANYPGTDKAVRAAYPRLWALADAKVRTKAEQRWEAASAEETPAALKLGREGWLAAELIKVNWRAANKPIVASWGAFEDAALAAVRAPGVPVRAPKAEYLAARGFLWCRLPSGRCLAYGAPRVHEMVWTRDAEDVGAVMDLARAERLARTGDVAIQGPAKSKVTALGVDAVTRKWSRYDLYGGLFCENNIQAISRDVMAAAMLKSERAGYPVVLTVHDEIVAEVPAGFGDVGDFERLISDAPSWAAGLPVVAEGWRGARYKK
jgi:DNA polymerase